MTAVPTFPDDYTYDWLRSLLPPDEPPLEPRTLAVAEIQPFARMRFVDHDDEDVALVVAVIQLPDGALSCLAICGAGHYIALAAVWPDGDAARWVPGPPIPHVTHEHRDEMHDVGAWLARLRDGLWTSPDAWDPRPIAWQ